MHGMLDLQQVKLRQEELLQEAETGRRAKSLRAARRRHIGRVPILAWETKRIAHSSFSCPRGYKALLTFNSAKQTLKSKNTQNG